LRGRNIDDKYYLPKQSGYRFRLTIGNSDFTSDLYRVVIATSVASPYQILTLDLFVDSADLILEKVYGQIPIQLSVGMLHPSGAQDTLTKFELLVIDSSFPVSPALNIEVTGKQKDRVPFSITAVCRETFKTMTTIVNEVYYNKTPKEVISDLVSKNTGATLQYEIRDENPLKIDQVIIPPTTLYQSIKYLDKAFGLYNGIPVVFCNHENKLKILNLTKKIQDSQTFNVYYIASGVDNTKIINKSLDGKNYYTYDSLKNDYSSNALFSVTAPKLRYIVKPRDTLYTMIEKGLVNICTEQGLIFKNSKVFFDNIGISSDKRIRYYIDHTGYDDDDYFIKSSVSKDISSLVGLKFNLEKNLPILNLMNVGEPVKLNIGTLELLQLGGKYILKSSQLFFEKTADWNAVATISLIRTNKSSI
jgi:hypothetical protein